VGVTAKAVKIGFSAIDTSSLKPLGPSYDTGDAVAAWRAIIDEARADGRLPVNGRDIDPYIVAADVDVTPNAPANRRAECLQMVEDAKVFAVVAGNQIDTDCVAKEHKVPLITSLLPGHDSDPQQVPMLFSTTTNFEKGLRNTAAWLIEAGVLKGHKLGLYYAEDEAGTYRPMLQQHFLSKIAAAGFKITKEIKYTQSDTGRESTHVLQFQSAGVDMILDFSAITLVSGPSFLNAAQNADYHPKYVELGVSLGSTFEGVSDNYNADQWNGTLTLLDDARSLEFGPQGRAGLSPATKKCADTIKRRRNQEIDPVKSSAAWQLYNQSCDLLNIVIEALKIAGPNLTRASFAAALEKLQLGPPLLGWWPSGGFGPEHNWGRQVRVARYDKDCSDKGRKVCWRPQGGYRPYWVP
jgi:ABC-type branched-subunit amino acid transport system substrate-binding protein